jgi:large subunit ribosomal protein L21
VLVTYAIVETGGKQYKIQPGDTIRVESLAGDEGDIITLDDVRMVSQDGAVTFGTPRVEGASVSAEVVGQGKGKKVVVFKYKAKTRYRRKNGHRQHYTALRIGDISIG